MRKTPLLFVALTASPLLVASLTLGAEGSAGKGRRVVEMPMHVQTEGTTYDEYRERQAALMTRLSGLSSAAGLNASIHPPPAPGPPSAAAPAPLGPGRATGPDVLLRRRT
jgi:hypothetical protein